MVILSQNIQKINISKMNEITFSKKYSVANFHHALYLIVSGNT